MSKLLYFGAEWCASCKALWPTVEKDAPEQGFDVKFIDCDSDEGAVMCEEWRVRGLPTLVVVDDSGNELKRAVGSTAWKEVMA